MKKPKPVISIDRGEIEYVSEKWLDGGHVLTINSLSLSRINTYIQSLPIAHLLSSLSSS